VADIVAGNFVTISISSSMVLLASSGVLKQVDGVLNYVYGIGARPMVTTVNIRAAAAISDTANRAVTTLSARRFSSATHLIPTIPSVSSQSENAVELWRRDCSACQLGMIDDVKKNGSWAVPRKP
jgi:hypothetical protein